MADGLYGLTGLNAAPNVVRDFKGEIDAAIVLRLVGEVQCARELMWKEQSAPQPHVLVL